MTGTVPQATADPGPRGPLAGVRVLELGGKGPTPFAGMLLADMGADVIVVARSEGAAPENRVLGRGKSTVRLDLRSDRVSTALLDALADVDVLIEGFRPGVAERLGLGPEQVHARHPRVVYARMTGFGQDNSFARTAGHDVNFIAMSSALAHIGPPDRPPVVPLNLVGDFGGGATFLVVGVLAALLERERSRLGQVVDAAMTDGSALLMASVYALHAAGEWSVTRGENMTDGAAPYYGVYRTADGRHLSIGALDPRHRAAVLATCGLDPAAAAWDDRAAWPDARETLAAVIATRTLAEWEGRFAGVDASVAPVLSIDEAWSHPYHRERGTFPVVDGVRQPAPAPRFDRTPSTARAARTEDAETTLRRLGIDARTAAGLVRDGLAG